MSLQHANQIVTHLNSLAIKGQVCSFAAQVLDVGRVLGSKCGQFLCQVGACIHCELSELIVSDNLVLLSGQNLTDRVAHKSVSMTHWSHHPCVFVVIETAREHLLCKRHKIGS